jgi:hypothetical protein
MVETRTIKSQLAEERPQHDLMLPFVRAASPAFRAGNLLGQVPCGLVSDHRFLNLMEQFLSFGQHQPKILWPQRVTFQLGHFLHDFCFAESDSMMSCTFSFITAILLSSSSTAASLPHIAEADDLPSAGQSDAA